MPARLSGSPAGSGHALSAGGGPLPRRGVGLMRRVGWPGVVLLAPAVGKGGEGALNLTRTRLVHEGVRPHCWYATMAPAPACCRPGSMRGTNARDRPRSRPPFWWCPVMRLGPGRGRRCVSSARIWASFPGTGSPCSGSMCWGFPKAHASQGERAAGLPHPHQAVLSAARAGRIGGGVGV